MKLEKAKQLKTIGTAVSLALLVGVGSVNAAGNGNGNGNGNGKSNSPNNNPTDEGGTVTELYGASVGVSSTCALTQDKNRDPITRTIFQVTTTITDKSSGDTIPSFPDAGSYVDYIGKLRGPKSKDPLNPNPYLISGGNNFDPNEFPEGDAMAGVVTNRLDLCAARDDVPPSLEDGTVSLNSMTAVYVSNSKGGSAEEGSEAFYTSQCVATDDSPKVVIDLGLLKLDCEYLLP